MADKVININLDEIKNRKTIIVFANKTQLKSIQNDLALADRSVKDLGSDLYELTLNSIKVESPEIASSNMSVNQLMGESVDTVGMFDFKGSDDFYAKAAKKKSYKIISDDYSDLRNQELYRGFQSIERGWRKLVLTWNIKHDVATEPKNSKVYDHAISTYTLSEFFEQFLFAPASESYVREQWRSSGARSEDDVVRVSSLKRLHEIGMNITEDELRTIQQRRNQCMHFRVITRKEYDEAITLINKYLIEELKKEFMDKTMESIKAISGHMYESLNVSLGSIIGLQSKFASQIASTNLVWPTVSPSIFDAARSAVDTTKIVSKN